VEAEYAKGMVVRHSTLGIGKVVALEATAVHVFFADGERREAAKLRISAAKAFLRPDPEARDERLEHLPAFALDPASGRYAPERTRPAAAKKKAKK
jgi:hypothetical protein